MLSHSGMSCSLLYEGFVSSRGVDSRHLQTVQCAYAYRVCKLCKIVTVWTRLVVVNAEVTIKLGQP
jgi:hypothetical protein